MFKYIQIEKLLLEGKSSTEIAGIVPCSIDYVVKIKSKLGIINGTEQMVEHHTHYKEIHGYDKTVWMTRSNHLKLHQHLRKNGECNVPVDELTKIASAAHNRTDKSKENMREYQAGQKYIEYINSSECIKYRRDYHLKNIWVEHQYTHMMPNITLKETIMYNMTTNHISISSGFYGTSKEKPLVINII